MAASLSQSKKPSAQVIPHAVPSQVGVAFGPVGQGVHEAPHVATSALLTHAFLQSWKPGLHDESHFFPSQLATEFGGGVHGVHEFPHVATSVLLTHALPQR